MFWQKLKTISKGSHTFINILINHRKVSRKKEKTLKKSSSARTSGISYTAKRILERLGIQTLSHRLSKFDRSVHIAECLIFLAFIPYVPPILSQLPDLISLARTNLFDPRFKSYDLYDIAN